MKIITIFLFVVTSLILLYSCSTKNAPTGVWINKEKIQGKSFNNIFIVVMTADIEARSVVENDLAETAISKGYKAVKSIDVLPPSFKDPKTPAKEEIINKVKESGCDAIFVATLLKIEDGIRYTPSKTVYAPTTYAHWNGDFYGYYSNYYPAVSTNAYYTKEKEYFMQSNLYDVVTEDIMWSVQSNIFKPASLKKFSKSYTSGLIEKLENETLLKKAKQ